MRLPDDHILVMFVAETLALEKDLQAITKKTGC